MTLATIDRYDAARVGDVGDRAVVVGASVAGLAAARVLADGFEEVVVIDRDPLPVGPVERDGSPQTSHPHVLLEAGRATLEDFFPGFSEDVLAAGGLLIDAAKQAQSYHKGGYVAESAERLPTYCASRPLFEHVVRQRVRGLDGIQLRGECRCTGYRTDESGRTVTGARIRDENGSETTLDAELVVDATGRASRTPRWLEANGYAAPPEDAVSVDLSYSSLRIDRPPTDRRLLTVAIDPPRTRGTVFIPIENGQWDVILASIHGTDTPTDRAGAVDFLRQLPVSEPADLVAERAVTSSEVDRYPFPASLRRHYEALDRFPAGLVVTGDAVSSFNPVYGQGMSVAVLDALVLHHALAEGGRSDLASRFFDDVAEVIDTVWRMAVGADFQFPQTTGPEPPANGLFNRYTSRLIRRAHHDGVLAAAFARVTRLEEPPTSLLRPGIVGRVLLPVGGD